MWPGDTRCTGRGDLDRIARTHPGWSDWLFIGGSTAGHDERSLMRVYVALWAMSTLVGPWRRSSHDGSWLALGTRQSAGRLHHPHSWPILCRCTSRSRPPLGIMTSVAIYDIIIVGSGMSGFAAAFDLQHQRPGTRVLILDGNPVFGGNAGAMMPLLSLSRLLPVAPMPSIPMPIFSKKSMA